MGLFVDLGGVGRGKKWKTVNLDARLRAAPDFVGDITCDLEKFFEESSIDALRCAHTLEHLSPKQIVPALRYWKKFLKPGGTLDIKVPDLGQMARHYAEGKIPFEVLASVAYVPPSRIKSDLEDHHWGWDRDSLCATLRRAGYMIARDSDPEFTLGGWAYDYEDMEYTGLVGNYKVPDLVVRALNQAPALSRNLVLVLSYDIGDGKGNRKTISCLKSLARSIEEGQVEKTAVIDNGPVKAPEGVFEGILPERVSFQRVTPPEPLSIIKAFNFAIGALSFPFDAVFCVTNDTISHPGVFAKLLSALSDPSVGIVAPGMNDRGAGVLFVPQPGNWLTLETSHVDNTFWGFRRDLVEAIGLPDDEGNAHWGSWYSNRDYCLRARRAGYSVQAVRSAYVRHEHDGGLNIVAELAGAYWFEKKWGFRG